VRDEILRGVLPSFPPTRLSSCGEFLCGICSRCWVLDPKGRLTVEGVLEDIKSFTAPMPFLSLRDVGRASGSIDDERES